MEAPGAVVTHGALAGSYTALRQFFLQQPRAAQEWSTRVGVDCGDSTVLAGLLLLYAVNANKSGPVLFFSRERSKIRDNVQCVENARFTPAQVENFAQLASASGLQAV